MKTLFKSAFICVICGLFTGCASTPRDAIPASEICATLNGKPARAVLPKDVQFSKLRFEVTTNGTVALEINDLKARTNPEVISMSGEAYAKAIEAQGKANASAFESGAKFIGAIPK